MNYIFHNFWYKLAALGLAVVIWVIIQGEQILEINREVAINLTIPDGYAIRGETSRVVAMTIKGPRVMVMETARILKADIEIPALKAKRYRVRVTPEQIKGVNQRLNLTIHEPYFWVYVDETSTRTVPIRYIPHGTPAEGFFVKKVVLEPSHVKITGLKSDLLKIREVSTIPVDISDIKESKTFEKALIPPQDILLNQMSIGSTIVNVQIGDSYINKRFGSILIEPIGSKYTSQISPKYASLVIQGTPSVLKFLKGEELKAFVDLSELEPGTYEKEIQVKIPPDTILIENYPLGVTVQVIGSEKNKLVKKK